MLVPHLEIFVSFVPEMDDGGAYQHVMRPRPRHAPLDLVQERRGVNDGWLVCLPVWSAGVNNPIQGLGEQQSRSHIQQALAGPHPHTHCSESESVEPNTTSF
jgi:hypothetical protein